MAAFKPSKEDLLALATTPAAEGGLSATQVDVDEELTKWINSDSVPLLPMDMNIREAASDDVRRLVYSLIKAPNRKATPDWSVPAELWLLCLQPDYFAICPDRMAGLGLKADIDQGEFRKARVEAEAVVAHCYRAQETPAVANFSQGFFVPRGNSKPGLGGLRLIHLMCPYWRHFYGAALKQNSKKLKVQWPHWCHAYLPRRRREAPMLVHRITTGRLAAAAVPNVSALRDMKNAFACTGVDPRSEAMEDLVAEGTRNAKGHRPFFEQRMRNAIVSLRGHNGEVSCQPGVGNFIGSSEGPKVFSRAFNKCISNWWRATKRIAPSMHFLHPCTREEVVAGLVAFADDTATARIVHDGTARSAAALLEMDDEVFNCCVAESGWRQNRSKQDIVANLRKFGQNTLLAEEIVKESQRRHVGIEGPVEEFGSVLPVARHLGGQFSWNGANQAEFAKRLRAMRNGCAELGSFWWSRTPWKVRRAVFLGKVVEAAIAGLLSFVFSEVMCAQLDSLVIKYVRSLMKGQAHSLDLEGNHDSLPNIEVLKKWKILPLYYEDCVRRTAWLRNMVLYPQDHEQVVSSLFGDMICEAADDWFLAGKTKVRKLVLQVLDEDGQIITNAPGAEYATAFYKAIRIFEGISGTEPFFEIWAETNYSMLVLLNCSSADGDDLLRHYLQNFDPTILRSAFYTGDFLLQYRETCNPCAEGLFLCQILHDNGTECLAQYATRAALTRHQIQCATHSAIHPIHGAVCTNQCPLCLSLFSSIASAKQHLEGSYKKGFCIKQLAHQTYTRQEPRHLCCKFCGLEFSSCGSLTSHLSEHLPSPRPAVLDHGSNSRSGARQSASQRRNRRRLQQQKEAKVQTKGQGRPPRGQSWRQARKRRLPRHWTRTKI